MMLYQPVTCRLAEPDELMAIYRFGEDLVGASLAAFETVRRIHEIFPDGLWVASGSSINYEEHMRYSGVFWFLPLRRGGVHKLISGDTDFRYPDIQMIAPDISEAEALYGWFIGARGKGRIIIRNMLNVLGQPPYAHLDGYATASTPQGHRLLTAFGFSEVSGYPDAKGARLMKLHRAVQ